MRSFRNKDPDQIMLGYTEESKFIFYDLSKGVAANIHYYHGLAEIRKFYVWLCAELVDTTLQSTAQEVQQGMAWFVWKNSRRGFVSGTDTVVYDEHHRVKYQNAVCTRTPGGSPPPYGCRVQTATGDLEAVLAENHPTIDA